MCRRLLKACLVVCFASSLAVACGDNSTGTGGDDTGTSEDCPRGTFRNSDGECVSPGGDDSGGTDAGPTDGSSTDTQDPPPDTTTPDDSGGTDGAGCSIGDCPDGKFCNEGECIVGMDCEAGKVLGCAGDSKKRVCLDKGLGWKREACPENKPHCRDGECNKTICEPGAKFCKGDAKTLMKCSDDGMSTEQVQLCRTRCQGGKCVSGCGGTAKESYIGCGFQAVDLDNNDQSRPGQPSANERQYAVTASNTTDKEVQVTVTDSGSDSQVASATLPPGDLKVINLDNNTVKNSVVADKSYQVDADGPITVHQFNPIGASDTATNDASLLLPSSAIGRNYTVVNWPSRGETRKVQTPFGEVERDLPKTLAPYTTVVAAQQGETKVKVETPTDIVSGNGVPALSAGQSHEFTLKQGEVLQMKAEQKRGNDVTGMTIEADQKVAVFGGHECSNVNLDSQFCDHLEQQLFPNKSLGKTYALSKFAPRGQEDDYFRVVAAKDGTTLTTVPPVSGIDGAKLDAGEVKEFTFRDNLLLKADKPVAVGQFMVGSGYPGGDQCNIRQNETSGCKVQTKCKSNTQTRIGDPAFMLNVATSQFLDEYVIQTPESYQEDWINVVAPKSATIEVDGSEVTSSGSQVTNTIWKVYQIEVEPGVHRIKSTGGKKFGLYGYGYSCDVSYAYPGGLDLSSNN